MTRCFFVNLQEITISELLSAKNKVDIAVAWVNFNVYFGVFDSLLKRGVRIRIILNNDYTNMNYQNIILSLTMSGAEIKLVDSYGIMHHKFCVIDNQRCLFGSYNWTKNAELRNIEDLNICDELELVYEYLKEFNALWELSKSDLRLLRNPAKCIICGTPQFNILLFEQDEFYHTKIQIMQTCDCGHHLNKPEYYNISVYNNYFGIMDRYYAEHEYAKQCNDQRYCDTINAQLDFDIVMYWSAVRRNKFGTEIIHAVGMPASRLYGRHDEDVFYKIIWKERGMSQYIPDEIPIEG